MKRLVAMLSIVLAVGTLTAGFVAWEAKEKCDLKTVQKASYCTKCKKFLDADQIDKNTTCKTCGTNVVEKEACVKETYQCAECGHISNASGKCHNKDMVKNVSKALVIWKCPMCAMVFEAAGQCTMCKKDLEKTCDQSGTAPHVGIKVIELPAEDHKDHEHK